MLPILVREPLAGYTWFPAGADVRHRYEVKATSPDAQHEAEATKEGEAKERPYTASFRPLTVDALPPGAMVVFVSHRWLRPRNPDDEEGTKLKQVRGRCLEGGQRVDRVQLQFVLKLCHRIGTARPDPYVSCHTNF
jgi:hypothetical protein